MLKLAANLDWLFTDLPIAARFRARQKRPVFTVLKGYFSGATPAGTVAGGQRQRLHRWC